MPILRLLPLLLALLTAACGTAPASNVELTSAGSGGINRPEQRDKPIVILVSFAGFRADYRYRF